MSYLPIRVNTLRGDQKVDFDVYVELPMNQRMVKVVHNGDSFEGERLQRLKAKKIKKMFILPEDEKSYRDYVSRSLAIAYDDTSGKDIQTRAEIIHGQQQSNAEDVFDTASEESYKNAKEGVALYMNFLASNDSAVGAIFKIENNDRSISHHGVNVATLTVALAKKLKYGDAKTEQLMALGALLHDYGHQETGLEIARPLKDFSSEELEIYNNHPTDGARSLQDKKHFDQLVINIVAQHEECSDGSGFPKGLKEKDMDPSVVIVSSANAYDRLMTLEGLDPKDAGKRMMIEQVGKHPLNHIQILSQILKET